MADRHTRPVSAGIGLRAAHYGDFMQGHPAIGWLEVHIENYFGAGGYDLHVLDRVRADYPLSLHGVGLSLGSADGLREAHLQKLQRLVERTDPLHVSEHLCWGAHGARHFNDLLPLPYTGEALELMVSRVDYVQTVLQRTILVENVSTYLKYRADEIPELEFIAELARRTGCGVLLDINNLYVNAINHGFDALHAFDALRKETIREIHLAGHSSAADCLIDDHGSQVTAKVWELYSTAIQKFGRIPTLIEWDTDIPDLQVLLDEAHKADEIIAFAHA